MTGESSPEQQLSEIRHIIAETQATSPGGGIVGLVWAVLTGLALVCLATRVVPDTWAVWAIHNLLGWAFTLAWFQQASKTEGRVSKRGISVLRLWAGITLAIWLLIWSLIPNAAGILAALPVLLGLGVLATALTYDDNFGQCTAVLMMISGPIIVLAAPASIAWVLIDAAVVGLGLVWGISSWLIKRRS